MSKQKDLIRRESAKLLQLSAYLARRSKTAMAHDDYLEGHDAGYLRGYLDAIEDVKAELRRPSAPAGIVLESEA